MRQQQLAKQPINYSVDHPETCKYEQKPIKEKNRKRRAASKKKNSEDEQVKKAKKREETKLKESKMWDKLNELNNKFKTIKQPKRDEKKMFSTIL